ncbi:hypothetical protein KFK09_026677 [Dendrobium nobile]|uniref:RCC1-like domain-containing protein n=1 Tax=Dendrobium nobile TaxID=94219 RepID=A0A8T3A774_DENNO|nr:hypothetical protein KFK09_026677 [Dendrobium nobile]
MKRSLFNGARLRTCGGAIVVSARSICSGGSWRSTSVWSFGDNSNGALGISSPLLDAYEPTKVPSLPANVTTIAAGHYHSLAVNADGEIWAWGRNEEGQLGRGLDAPRDKWRQPERVLGLDDVNVQAAYASGVVSAAVGDDGSLWVWGRSKRGQLGLGKGVTEAVKPTKVEALLGHEICKVSFGWGHALAFTRDRKLFGWGYAEDGRLGKMGEALISSSVQEPNFYSSLDKSVSMFDVAEKLVAEKMEKENNMPIIWAPSLVQELSSIEVSDAACGLDHSLVLCCDGTVFSSGDNTLGQLGRDTEGTKMLPVQINNFHPISLAAGLGHSLLLYLIPSKGEAEEAAGILSWGWNCSSQLGRHGSEKVPSTVAGLDGKRLVSVAAGRVHSISLTSKGEVWTWGSGRNGRLGLGSSADEAEPTFVECLEGLEVLQAIAGFDHNLLLIAD